MTSRGTRTPGSGWRRILTRRSMHAATGGARQAARRSAQTPPGATTSWSWGRRRRTLRRGRPGRVSRGTRLSSSEPEPAPRRDAPGSERAPIASLIQARQLLLRLLQPEPHVHLAVHRRRGREVLVGLLALPCASVELPQAEV